MQKRTVALPSGAPPEGEIPLPPLPGPIVPPPTSTDAMREALRMRLGVPSIPSGLSDAYLADILTKSDDQLRAQFRLDFCKLPPAGFANDDEIRAWNAANPWCQPVALTGGGTAGRGRRALMDRLHVSVLPDPSALSDAQADAMLSLSPDALHAEFVSRFCTMPTFATQADRDAWVASHPWCFVPAPSKAPWLWIGGLAFVSWLASKAVK